MLGNGGPAHTQMDRGPQGSNGGISSFDDLFGGKGLLGWLGNLFGKKNKTPQVAAPTPDPAPAVVAPKPWESGVNSTYGNAFGASPTQTTFGTLLSRQPTI